MKNKIISTMLAVAAVCIMVTGCAAVESKADAIGVKTVAAAYEASDVSDDSLEERLSDQEFSDYDEIIEKLQPGEGYAYLPMDGADKEVLAVTDFTYNGDTKSYANTAIAAVLFEQCGDKVINLGSVTTGTTAYPLRFQNGIFYVCNQNEYAELQLEENEDGTDGIGYLSHAVIEEKADDTVEMQKWGKAAGKEEKEIREDIDKSTVKPPIDFTVIK